MKLGKNKNKLGFYLKIEGKADTIYKVAGSR
jgi:hypothetical protein